MPSEARDAALGMEGSVSADVRVDVLAGPAAWRSREPADADASNCTRATRITPTQSCRQDAHTMRNVRQQHTRDRLRGARTGELLFASTSTLPPKSRADADAMILGTSGLRAAPAAPGAAVKLLLPVWPRSQGSAVGGVENVPLSMEPAYRRDDTSKPLLLLGTRAAGRDKSASAADAGTPGAPDAMVRGGAWVTRRACARACARGERQENDRYAVVALPTTAAARERQCTEPGGGAQTNRVSQQPDSAATLALHSIFCEAQAGRREVVKVRKLRAHNAYVVSNACTAVRKGVRQNLWSATRYGRARPPSRARLFMSAYLVQHTRTCV